MQLSFNFTMEIGYKYEVQKMNEILVKQFAIDFCTDETSVLSKENIFTEYKRLEGRRIFQEGGVLFKGCIRKW